MTRGRRSNHVHVITEPADDDIAHRPRPPCPAPLLEDAVRVLQDATSRVGAQQAAHQLLDEGRHRASKVRIAGVGDNGVEHRVGRSRQPAKPVAQARPQWRSRGRLPASPSPGRSLGL
jgi:hypothetical protein